MSPSKQRAAALTRTLSSDIYVGFYYDGLLCFGALLGFVCSGRMPSERLRYVKRRFWARR